MKNFAKIVFTIALLLFTRSSFAQATYFVKPGASGSGSSWSDASGDLQSMINKSNAGDQIWVAAGIYKPQSTPGATGTLSSRDVSFVLKSGVKIYGGFNGTENAVSERNLKNNVTILSGDIGNEGNNSDNAHHVIISLKNTAGTLVDGFTITGGNANAAGAITLDGVSIFRYSGGGIYANSSNTIFKNVIVQKNKCGGGEDYFGNGGGVYAVVSQLTFEDASISENESERIADKAGGTSGAVFISGSSTVRSQLNLNRVLVQKNVSMNTVGAITLSSYTDADFKEVDFIDNKTNSGLAGALRIAGASETSFNNFKMEGGSFVRNTAPAAGGAVYVWSFTNYHFNGVNFSENKSLGSAGGAAFLFSGGGEAAPNDKAIFSNCVFYKNEALGTTLGGGGIFISNGTKAKIVNATFYDNYAKFDGGAFGAFSNPVVKVEVSNTIIFNNNAEGDNSDFYVGAASTLELMNSITQKQGVTGVNGVKVGIDPLFSSTDPSTPYFLKLLKESPAIDAGENSKISANVTKDIAGNDRIINDVVDLGAHEFKEEGGPTISQTITFSSDINKKYGADAFDPGATASSGLPINYTSSNTDVAIFENGKIIIKGAGTIDLTANQAGNFEYLPAASVTRKLIIEKADLLIRAADTSMIQGDPLPKFRTIYSGFVYSDNEEALIQKPVFTTSATSASPDGDYEVLASGAEALNYSIQYEPSKLSIVTVYPEGKIRYVKPVSSGTGSGLNWDNASNDLQAMIDAASSGGEVWVAKGTYMPNSLSGSSGAAGGRDVAFVLKNDVGVYGGFAGTEVRRSDRNINSNKTILSGDIGVVGTQTDNAYHVVVSVNNTRGTVLDGFTITNGVAGGTGSYTVHGVAIDKNAGGGIYVSGAQDVLFENLDITKNNVITSGIGAGIMIKSSRLTMKNSSISENITEGSTGQGAGFYFIGAAGAVNQITLENVMVKNNKSIRTGGGGYIGTYADVIFKDCVIEDNTGSEGAGVHIGSGAQTFKNKFKFIGTKFINNIGLATGNGGGLLVAQYNALDILNCHFSGNVAGYQGGAIYMNGNASDFSIFNVEGTTFSGNKLLQPAGNGGALRINFFVDAWVKNSIFYDNEASGGGAISLVGSSDAPTKNFYIVNNLFYNNKSTGLTSGGGAISTSNYMTANIINNTFYNNEAVNEGGAIRILQSRTLVVNIYNSLFNGNKAAVGKDLTMPDYPEIDFKNNFTQESGTHGVDGMIVGANPNFESTNPSDPKFLHLSDRSEAINKGDNAFLLEGTDKDLAGNDRIIHNVVDMGAYEYAGPPLNPEKPQSINFTGDILKKYGDAEFNPGAIATSGLPVTYTSSNAAIAVITNSNTIRLMGAGTVEITAIQNGNAQYLPAEPVKVNLTVSKANLIIRPNDLSVEQGKEFPQFTTSYIGLVNNDTESSISIPAIITTTATESSPIGTYDLIASGAQSDKYEISYEKGKLTITEPVWVPSDKVGMEAWFSSPNELQVQIDMISGQKASLILYSNIGVPVYRSEIDLHPGKNKITIPVSRLISGVYIVNVRGAELKLEKKIIKR